VTGTTYCGSWPKPDSVMMFLSREIFKLRYFGLLFTVPDCDPHFYSKDLDRGVGIHTFVIKRSTRR
jgi:hypothetical protein